MKKTGQPTQTTAAAASMGISEPVGNVVSVTALHESDATAVAALEREYFQPSWSENQIRRALGLRHFRILGVKNANGQLLAYISFFQVLDEQEIVNIAVRSQWRRRGLGQALLLAAIREGTYSGAARSLLEVRQSNIPAIALYRKCGFSQIGVRKGYYTNNNENALVFELKLTPATQI